MPKHIPLREASIRPLEDDSINGVDIELVGIERAP